MRRGILRRRKRRYAVPWTYSTRRSPGARKPPSWTNWSRSSGEPPRRRRPAANLAERLAVHPRGVRALDRLARAGATRAGQRGYGGHEAAALCAADVVAGHVWALSTAR